MRCSCGRDETVATTFWDGHMLTCKPGAHPEVTHAMRVCHYCGVGYLLAVLETGAIYGRDGVKSSQGVRVSYTDLGKIAHAMIEAMMPGGHAALESVADEARAAIDRGDKDVLTTLASRIVKKAGN